RRVPGPVRFALVQYGCEKVSGVVAAFFEWVLAQDRDRQGHQVGKRDPLPYAQTEVSCGQFVEVLASQRVTPKHQACRIGRRRPPSRRVDFVDRAVGKLLRPFVGPQLLSRSVSWHPGVNINPCLDEQVIESRVRADERDGRGRCLPERFTYAL